jgi:hypothetical protein
MLYQLFEQAIVAIKKTEPDQKALHSVLDEIVRKITENGSTESSLKLLKYLFFRHRRNHSSFAFFSDTTKEYLITRFKKDPSNLTSTFLYSLSIYEKSSNIYLLEKMTYSAWKFKNVVDEAVKECKVYG